MAADYDALCQAPTPYCINGSCEPCPVGETLNSSGKCIDCFSSDRILWGLNIDTCHVCSNRFWIGSCWLCESKRSLNGTYRADLSRCPHRYMPGTAEQGTSHYCVGTVNAGQTACDWDCPAGQIGVGSQCWTCTEEMSGPATLNECRKCDNRMFVGMDEKNGSCASCSSPLAISYVRRVDCLKCPNRYMPGTGTTAGSGVCYLCDGTVSADGTACLPKSE